LELNIRENYKVIVEKHPHSESLNKKLMEDIKNFYFYSREECGNYTNVKATQHSVKSEEKTKSMQLIENWVKSLLERRSSIFFSAPREHDARININMWFAKYNKGDYTLKHTHMDYATYAFVYFVNSPKGSSPLVFTTSGKRIKPEEGKIIIFPPQLFHHVPKNKCDGRITLSGNVGMVECND
tara:strand:+ start:37 stop:585 length:549 start_codon:yes stop_codon:yes gene_type:complete